MPAGPVVRGAADGEQLPVGGGQRRPGRALGQPQRQEGQPGPLQQRLDQPFRRGDGALPGIGRDQVEAVPAEQVDGGGDRAGRQHDVGVEEDQDVAARVGGVGELLAGVRLAQPAGRQRSAGEDPRAEPAGDVAGAVGRAVVEHEHLGDPVLGQRGRQAGADPRRLVAYREQHRHPLRTGPGRRVGPAQQRGVHRGVGGAGGGQDRAGADQPADHAGTGTRRRQRQGERDGDQPHAEPAPERRRRQPEEGRVREHRGRVRPEIQRVRHGVVRGAPAPAAAA